MHKLLEGSLIIKAAITLNAWLGNQWRGSLIRRCAVSVFALFGRLLQGSLLARGINAASSWFGKQWNDNRIVRRFLSPGAGLSSSESSVFARMWLFLHRILCTAFEKLRINKLLRGSVLTMPYIWSFGVLTLAPILPTTILFALVIVSAASLILAFGCDRNRRLAYSPINKYLLLYALVYICATFTSVTVSGSLSTGVMTTFFILFAIVIQNSVTSRRQLHAMVYAFVLSGAAVSAYGVYQYLSGNIGYAGWIDSTMFSGIGVRVYSTLDNPNILAQYLLLVIPFAAASILVAKRFVPKLIFTGCLGAALLCMVLTSSRGGWLGLVVAAAVFLVMIDRRFIIVGIIGLIVLYYALPATILNRFLSIGDVGDSSTSYRVSIWLATIAMLRDYWFTGIGPGTVAFNRIYPVYSFNAASAQHSHNLYLQIMCSTGIAGIIVFLVCIFVYFRHLCAALSNNKDKSARILQIAAVSSILGFLAQGMSDYSFYNNRVTAAFWAVLGLGMLCMQRAAPARDQGSGARGQETGIEDRG